MNLFFSKLRGIILGLVSCFLTTVLCQWNHPSNGYQYHPTTPQWQSSDLLWQNSIRRPVTRMSKPQWRNPHSKPQWQTSLYKPKWQDQHSKSQWQTSMYKPKWQDPLSKPQWQGMSKPSYWRQFSKQHQKNSKPNMEWRGRWNNNYRPTSTNSLPRNNAPREWPEYIPPLSVIRPAMDDPPAPI